MLWILAGAPHSGKKSFRDMLIREYGFRAIFKYTGSNNMKGGSFDVEDINSKGEKESFNIARRDFYLRVPERKDIDALLNDIIAGIDTDKKISRLRDEFGDDKIIYSKLDKGDGEKFYYILEEDVIEAAFSNDEHCILVCTDFKAIKRIKDVCKNCEDNSTTYYGGKDCRKNYSIKLMYLFGYVNDGKSKVCVTNKYINNLFKKTDDSSIDIKDFDYVFTNLTSMDNMSENFKKQWESLVIRQWDMVDDKQIPIKLEVDDACDSQRIQSGIFFAKPFSKKGDNGRGKVIYDAINHIGLLIARNYRVKERYSAHKDATYVLGELKNSTECHPIRIVQYDPESTGIHIVPSLKKDIENSNLIIVDLTDKYHDLFNFNPNCCWELGYARSLHKRIIVLVDSESKLKKMPDEGDEWEYKYELTDDNEFIIETSHDISLDDNKIPVRFGLKRNQNKIWTYTVDIGRNPTRAFIDSILNGYFRRLSKAITNRLRHQYYFERNKNKPR